MVCTMFDKGGFNRTLFNRSSSEGVGTPVEAIMSGSGEMTVGLQLRTRLTTAMTGMGGMAGALSILTPLPINMTGMGGMDVDDLVLTVLKLTIAQSGDGKMSPGIVMNTPVNISFSGEGGMVVDDIVLQLPLTIGFSSLSKMDIFAIAQRSLGEINFIGEGMITNVTPTLEIPLTMSFSGDGGMKLRRLTEIDKTTFELEGINLLPGSTHSVFIDTDLLNVAIDGILDVSSVTSESEFFELLPGVSTIKIETDSNMPMEVTLIWSNRWL